jgi:hypothetical protein
MTTWGPPKSVKRSRLSLVAAQGPCECLDEEWIELQPLTGISESENLGDGVLGLYTLKFSKCTAPLAFQGFLRHQNAIANNARQ